MPNDDDNDADNVGSPIVATDANGDTVTYTLGGADASLFRVRVTVDDTTTADADESGHAQLEVKGKLDHEKSEQPHCDAHCE